MKKKNISQTGMPAQAENISLLDVFKKLTIHDHIEILKFEETNYVASPFHNHHFFEIIYCLNSSNTEFVVGNKHYVLNIGDVLLIPAKMNHGAVCNIEPQKAFQGYALFISERFTDSLFQNFPFLHPLGRIKNHKLCLRNTVWEHLGNYFKSLETEYVLHPAGSDSAMIGLIIVLMTNLARAAEFSHRPSQLTDGTELLDKILSYIDVILFKKFSVSDIAARFMISESTIAHVFTQKLGISFHQYVTQRRLAEASKLIIEGVPIEKASVQVGFGDYSSFFRAFRKQFGISPRQFRISHAKD